MDANELMRKITHLETEVTEHRMRSDAFKTNFDRLKVEHSQLNEENERLQKEISESREIHRSGEDRLQQLIARERREKEVAMAECDELRSQIITPHRLELIKHQLVENLERTYKEIERETAQLQCQRLQDQVNKGLEDQEKLASRVHELEKDNLSLKSRLDEADHSHRVEQSNLKLSLLQSRGEIERERDALMTEVESSRTKIEVLQRAVDDMTTRIADKENDVSRRVQVAVDEELQQYTELEQEKLQLEAHVAEIERARAEDITSHQSELGQLEDRVRTAESAKESIEKENIQLKSQVQREKRRGGDLEAERVRCQELQQKLQQFQTKYQNVVASENECQSINDKLKSRLELMNEELRQTHSNVRRQDEENAMVADRQKLAWEQERRELTKRMEECEQQRLAMSERLQKARADVKREKKNQKELAEVRERIERLSSAADDTSHTASEASRAEA